MHDKKFFLELWFSSILEKLVRLSRHLDHLADIAPRSNGDVPFALKSLKEDVQSQIASVLPLTAQLRGAQEIRRAALPSIYRSCRNAARAFVILHSRLAHFPREWARSEIELFLATLEWRLEGAKVKNGSLSERLTVTTSAKYNFGNILDPEKDIASDSERYDGSRDIIKIPAVEQSNSNLWPLITHEIGHSVFRKNNYTGNGLFDALLKQCSVDQKNIIDQNWIEEIFCDLFAAAVIGPVYYITMMSYLKFWSMKPVGISSKFYPSTTDRISYIREYLSKTGRVEIEWATESFKRVSSAREELDFEVRQTDYHEHQEKIRSGKFPDSEITLKLARIISDSNFFKSVIPTQVPLDMRNVEDLSNRLSMGQFIASKAVNSNTGPEGSTPTSIEDLEEQPNELLEILTASILHSSGMYISHRQRDLWQREAMTQSFQFRFLNDVIFSSSGTLVNDCNGFTELAADYIRKSDETVIRSLEVASIHKTLFNYKRKKDAKRVVYPE